MGGAEVFRDETIRCGRCAAAVPASSRFCMSCGSQVSLPHDAAAPEDDAEAALRRAAVRTALTRLEPRERELVALKFHAGLANAEIAAVLGVSVSNAGTQLHRAMTKLREAVEHA
jgi:RNA polymerase sigma-70 factor (ECF subfamily)